MEKVIIAILLATIIVLAWAYNRLWEKKEHYRCRVFDLSGGKEGSNLVKVSPIDPPPAPEGLFPTRPLLTEWLRTPSGEYFHKKSVVAISKNPNGTMNIVLGNGYVINTMTEEEDIKTVLGIHFSPTIYEELRYKKEMRIANE